MEWKRPRPAPAAALRTLARPLAEIEEEWNRQAERYASSLPMTPLLLRGDEHHPLVRTEIRLVRKWQRLLAGACLTVPLAVFAACVVAASAGGEDAQTQWSGAPPPTAGQVAATLAARLFVCIWPTLMFGGAALGAAVAVISDRTRHTVSQVVLTPVSGRVIAAARILPWPGPFLLGTLAAAPLYIWAGGWAPLCPEGLALTPLALWPMRLMAMPFAAEPQNSLAGHAMCGAFMVAADGMLVWAAAHWGACYAVWLGNLPGTVAFMLWRLLYVSLIMSVLWAPASILALPSAGLPGLGLPPQAGLLLFLLWRLPVRDAVRSALVEFLRYDRLAGDDFNPGYFKRFRVRVRSEGPPRL